MKISIVPFYGLICYCQDFVCKMSGDKGMTKNINILFFAFSLAH